MNVFDCHFHIETGLDRYNIDVAGKNIIFNSFDSYRTFKDQATAADSVSLIFDYKDHYEDAVALLAEGKLDALKIHSRIQKLTSGDYPELLDYMVAAKPAVPIIVDAFFFGDDLEYQPNLAGAAAIAKKFSHVPVIIAHCGGIEILKYFYHLKTLDNIYFDLSLGLAYLKNTSVFADYKNLIKFGSADKILFGTDYPFISPKAQLDTFLEIAAELKMKETVREQILFGNAQKLFKPGGIN